MRWRWVWLTLIVFIGGLYAFAYCKAQEALDALHDMDSDVHLLGPHKIGMNNWSLKTKHGQYIKAPKVVLNLELLALVRGHIKAKAIILESPNIQLKGPIRKSLPELTSKLAQTFAENNAFTLIIQEGQIRSNNDYIHHVKLQTKLTDQTLRNEQYRTTFSGVWQPHPPLRAHGFNLAFLAQKADATWSFNNLTLAHEPTEKSTKSMGRLTGIFTTDAAFKTWQTKNLIVHYYNASMVGNASFDATKGTLHTNMTLPSFDPTALLQSHGITVRFGNPKTFTSLKGQLNWTPSKKSIALDFDQSHLSATFPQKHFSIDKINILDYRPSDLTLPSFLRSWQHIMPDLQKKAATAHIDIEQLIIGKILLHNATFHILHKTQKAKILLHAQTEQDTSYQASAVFDGKTLTFDLPTLPLSLSTLLSTCGITSPLQGEGSLSMAGTIDHKGQLANHGTFSGTLNTPINPKLFSDALNLDEAWNKHLIAHPFDHITFDYQLKDHRLIIRKLYASSPEVLLKGTITMDLNNQTITAKGRVFDLTQTHPPKSFVVKQIAYSKKALNRFLSS